MAKNAFVVYRDWWALIEPLSLEERGILLTAMFQFHENPEVEIEGSVTVKAVFNFMRQTFSRDTAKYAEKCRRNAENARKAHDIESDISYGGL